MCGEGGGGAGQATFIYSQGENELEIGSGAKRKAGEARAKRPWKEFDGDKTGGAEETRGPGDKGSRAFPMDSPPF